MHESHELELRCHTQDGVIGGEQAKLVLACNVDRHVGGLDVSVSGSVYMGGKWRFLRTSQKMEMSSSVAAEFTGVRVCG